MEDAERDLAGENSLFDDKQEMLDISSSESNSVGDVDGEAQIDPRCFAPLPIRRNATTQKLKTSLLFVLFEYCLKEGILSLYFSDDLSTIWKLDKFANASFHSGFQTSVSKWRQKISEDAILRDRLIKQHKMELISLTYPLPKRSGANRNGSAATTIKGLPGHFISDTVRGRKSVEQNTLQILRPLKRLSISAGDQRSPTDDFLIQGR